MRHVKDDQRVIWLWRERERERELFGRLGSQPSGNIVASKASHRAAANVINIQHVFYSNLVNTLPMFYIVLTNHRKFLLSRSISCILLLLRSTSLKHRPICGSPCHVPSLREREHHQEGAFVVPQVKHGTWTSKASRGMWVMMGECAVLLLARSVWVMSWSLGGARRMEEGTNGRVYYKLNDQPWSLLFVESLPYRNFIHWHYLSPSILFRVKRNQKNKRSTSCQKESVPWPHGSSANLWLQHYYKGG